MSRLMITESRFDISESTIPSHIKGEFAGEIGFEIERNKWGCQLTILLDRLKEYDMVAMIDGSDGLTDLEILHEALNAINTLNAREALKEGIGFYQYYTNGHRYTTPKGSGFKGWRECANYDDE